jgi:hypothetical protein
MNTPSLFRMIPDPNGVVTRSPHRFPTGLRIHHPCSAAELTDGSPREAHEARAPVGVRLRRIGFAGGSFPVVRMTGVLGGRRDIPPSKDRRSTCLPGASPVFGLRSSAPRTTVAYATWLAIEDRCTSVPAPHVVASGSAEPIRFRGARLRDVDVGVRRMFTLAARPSLSNGPDVLRTGMSRQPPKLDMTTHEEAMWGTNANANRARQTRRSFPSARMRGEAGFPQASRVQVSPGRERDERPWRACGRHADPSTSSGRRDLEDAMMGAGPFESETGRHPPACRVIRCQYRCR